MARSNLFFPRLRVEGGGDGAESHDLLTAGHGRRCQLAAGRGGGRDEGTEEVFSAANSKIRTDGNEWNLVIGRVRRFTGERWKRTASCWTH